MKKDMIEALEAEIQKETQGLIAKKAILHELKKESKLPGQSKFSRAWLKTVKFVSSPFASAASSADMALKFPHEYAAEKLINKAYEFLKKNQEVVTPNCRGAKRVCNKAASLVIELEEFLSKNSEELEGTTQDALYFKVQDLREKVEVTRPPKTEDQKRNRKELQALVDQKLQEAMSSIDNLNQTLENFNNDGNSNESSDNNDSGSVRNLRETPEERESVSGEAQSTDGCSDVHRGISCAGRDVDGPVCSSNDGCDGKCHAPRSEQQG